MANSEEFEYDEATSQFLVNSFLKNRTRSLERCPLCNHKANVYYCKDCIKNGTFSHSKSKIHERYADKMLIRGRILEQLKYYESLQPEELKNITRKKMLIGRIEDLKQRIELRRNTISQAKQDIFEVNSKRQSLEREKILYRRYLRNLYTKHQTYRSSQQTEEMKADLMASEHSLQKWHNYNIEQLKKYIFPITRKPTMDDREMRSIAVGDEDKVAALADASQTHYIKGRWVTTTYSLEHSFNIVSANLPASGHYSFFDALDPEGAEKENHNTKNICVGLSYVTHLVNILSCLLGVVLPKKVLFRDFIEFTKEDFNEEKFHKFVGKLNINIVYLCISQGVPSESLHPSRAIPNLLALLYKRPEDAARQNSFEFSQSLLETLEDECAPADQSDSDSDTDLEYLGSEWVDFCSLLGDLPYETAAAGGTLRDAHQPATEDSISAMAVSGINYVQSSFVSLWSGFTSNSHK